MLDLETIRREYLRGGLRRNELASDPNEQFSLWMEQAIEMGITDPTAMTVASVSTDGQPSQRIVLLKHFDEQGFVFYTNYDSHKGQELAANSKISLHFPWHTIERQIKIKGVVEKTSQENSREYFYSRPRESQVAALISAQSESIDGRKALEKLYHATLEKFQGSKVPMPDNWGGYRVAAHEFEFWQGGAHRLHDRFVYTMLANESWRIDRLAP